MNADHKMGFAQSVLNSLVLAECVTIALLAIPFPTSMRKILIHVASVSFAGLGIGAAMTVAVPFLDSLTVFMSDGKVADSSVLAQANLDLYRGLLVFILLVVVLVQRFQVAQICQLDKELKSAKLNLEVIKKQATSASAESLRMVDELDSIRKGDKNPATKKKESSSAPEVDEKDALKLMLQKLEKQVESQRNELDDSEQQLVVAKREFDVLKQQAKGMEREYQRMADELEALRSKSKKEVSHVEDDNDKFSQSVSGSGLTQRRSRKAE